MTHLDLFSGIGGFALAARWAGFETIAFSEIEPFCCKLLAKRFPGIPNLGDVKRYEEWSIDRPDIITAGVPCQAASCAGKRRGVEDDRWLWPQALGVVRRFHPRWFVAENPTGILSLESGDPFEDVLATLEDEGYETQLVIIPACAVGAWHRRDRVWIIAHSTGGRFGRGAVEKCDNKAISRRRGCNVVEYNKTLATDAESVRRGVGDSANDWTPAGEVNAPSDADQPATDIDEIDGNDGGLGSGGICGQRSPKAKLSRCEADPHAPRLGSQGYREYGERAGERLSGAAAWEESWIEAATRICGGDDGLPHRVDRLRGLGNAIVPQVALMVFEAIKKIV